MSGPAPLGDVVLRAPGPSRKAYRALVVGAAACAVAGAAVGMSAAEPFSFVAWSATLFFATLCFFGFILGVRYYDDGLRLTPDGFSLSLGAERVAYRWSQVRRFYALELKGRLQAGRRVVAIDFAPGDVSLDTQTFRVMRAMAQAVWVPKKYGGLSVDDMAALLEARRRAATGGAEAPDPQSPVPGVSFPATGSQQLALDDDRLALLRREAGQALGILAALGGIAIVTWGAAFGAPALRGWMGQLLLVGVVAFYASLSFARRCVLLRADAGTGEYLRSSGEIRTKEEWSSFWRLRYSATGFTDALPPRRSVLTVGSARVPVMLSPLSMLAPGSWSGTLPFEVPADGSIEQTPNAHRLLRLTDGSGRVLYDALGADLAMSLPPAADLAQPAVAGSRASRLLRRALAFAIDAAAVIVALVAVVAALYAAGTLRGIVDLDRGFGVILLFPLVPVAYLLYFTVACGRGRSVGMRLVGLRIRDAGSDRRIGYVRAFVRTAIVAIAAYAIVAVVQDAFSYGTVAYGASRAIVDLPVEALIGVAALVAPLLERRERGLQDLVAGSVVVDVAVPPA